MTARAFWTVAPGRGEIREEALPPRGTHDVRVRTLFSGVSRGTEALVFAGRVPASEHQRMRAPFQAGDFSGPVKYGYASVGCVDEGPAEWQGRTVFALYPHQTTYIVPSTAVQEVPADVPAARAILAANMETAVNGVWDANPRAGDTVAVVGAGAVGCLVAWLAGRMPGAHVTLIDLNPARAGIARALGVGFATPAGATGEYDLVVHASGSPAGLPLALRLAGLESTVVEMSWYGDQAVTVPLGESFHARRLRIVSSQVGRVAPAQRARWDHTRRLRLALSLLADSALDALITGETSFDALPQTMPHLAAASGDTICHRIRY